MEELRRGITLDDLNSDEVDLYGPEKWKQNLGVKNPEGRTDNEVVLS